MKYINYLFIIILFAVAGCTKETVHTLVYPTTFKFNTPLLQDRAVFKIDSFYTGSGSNKKLNWKFQRIIEDIGTFNRSDAIISDTLNKLIRSEFSNNIISKIVLLSPQDMEISTGRLILDPKNPLKDSIIITDVQTLKYQANGNFLMPGMYLNNESRDIYVCNEFIYANKRISKDSLYYSYFRNDCNGLDYNASLGKFVDSNNFLKFDTASVEYVNYIFSSYK